MMFAVVFVYAFLCSFVLSSATRNKRENRPNPPMVDYVGYALVGISIVACASLLMTAAIGGEAVFAAE